MLLMHSVASSDSTCENLLSLYSIWTVVENFCGQRTETVTKNRYSSLGNKVTRTRKGLKHLTAYVDHCHDICW